MAQSAPLASRAKATSSPTETPTSFVIVGADGYLTARPATPVQVAHACRAAGYAAAIPATWGDELIAEACAERLATRTLPSAIFCSCRRVRDRLLGPGPDLVPFLMSFVAPPVATARYLRRLYGDAPLDITYVGGCPSAGDDAAIDRQIRPEDFFASLIARGIVPAQEPLVFNSFFAPDRRRCHSLPGGLPIDRILQGPDGSEQGTTEDTAALPIVPRSVVEIREVEYAAELAQYLIMAAPVLLDLAPRLGCVCSGALPGIPVTHARAAVMSLEPPRSPTPVVERDMSVDVFLDPAAHDTPAPLLADAAPAAGAADPADQPTSPATGQANGGHANGGRGNSGAAAGSAANGGRAHQTGGIA
jgi:hypothetical protein